MGRELKRVPLDFEWPLGVVWEGFINPFWKKMKDCSECGGEGEINHWPCQKCDGRGWVFRKNEDYAAYEAWQETDPPTGEGWQLWETVSEGSPISPVFPTKESFIEYLVSEGYNPVAAAKFADVGWAPSFASFGRVLKSGIDALPDIIGPDDTTD